MTTLPTLAVFLAAVVAVPGPGCCQDSRSSTQPATQPSGQASRPSSRSGPPHIVFLLADDLGFRDVGFHGSEIKTPNIDRLAKEGTRLEQFYVQQVCSPTRAAFLTGRYPSRTGLHLGVIRPWEPWGLGLDERLLPQILKEAGYETAICGKWHLGHHTPKHLPTARGFDHQYGHYCGAIDYLEHRRGEGKDWNRDDKPLDEAGYSTELIAKESVRLITSHDTRKPLFLYVPFNAPHTPLQAPQRYLEMYEGIPRPNRRRFAAMVTCLDDAVGTILKALDRRGMRNDTLVIFTSDNGGPSRLPGRRGARGAADNSPLRGRKGNLYEGGVRVPTVVSWPGRLKPGTVVNAPLHIVDMLPTLAGLAGASTAGTKPLDGKDVWATIADGRPSPHEEILLGCSDRGGAIRVGDWKLVRGGGDQGRVELFDLATDQREQHDLAAKHPAVVKDLGARLERYTKAASKAGRGATTRPPGFQTPQRWGHPDPKKGERRRY